MAPAVERVLHAARPARLGMTKLQDLAVAVTEAISNAAVHGNRLDPGQAVNVVVTVTVGRVTVDVRDEGPGFDSEAVSDPTAPERILIPGGRGIFLMRRLADAVAFVPPGNSVRLTFRRPGPRSRASRARRKRKGA